MYLNRVLLSATAASALLLASSVASAASLFVGIEGGNSGTENILFNGTQSGNVIQGFTNQSNVNVNFDSTSIIRGTAANGQAVITGDFDGTTQNPNDTLPFNDICVFLDAPDLIGKLIWNLNTSQGTGTVQFTAIDANNIPINLGSGNVGNGANFFTIIDATGLKEICVVSDAPINFVDIRQVRIGVAGVTPVPLPAAAMSGMVLLGGLAIARRRSRQID